MWKIYTRSTGVPVAKPSKYAYIHTLMQISNENGENDLVIEYFRYDIAFSKKRIVYVCF